MTMDRSDRESLTRRRGLQNLGMAGVGIGLQSLLARESPGSTSLTHFAPRAKRLIVLFQSGAPSQLDLFDPKPVLHRMRGQDLPESIRNGQRLTTMSARQSHWPLAPSHFQFERHGASGASISELLPHTASVADDLCIIRSMYTEAINHDPAITFMQTGSQLSGRPSTGAWLSYGLGSLNDDLPTFVAMVTKNQGGQPVYSRLWGSGFLPASHQGVRFRSGKDAILYLNSPQGVSRQSRRMQVERLSRLERIAGVFGAATDVESRIRQYELAFRMQASVPEITDISGETESTLQAYGPDAKNPGTYASNCLLARRLIERGVRCVQLFHRGWDHHDKLPRSIRGSCQKTDQPSAALIRDLKQRGLLDDTLVLWCGEFGRTSYSQGRLTKDSYGRDHHPRCFSLWMAGGGVQPGTTWGSTDDFGYNIQKDGVHVHDLHATMLHLFGFDHEQLTYHHQGRRFRLTDVHGQVVRPILA